MTAEAAVELSPERARAYLDYVLTLYWDKSVTQAQAARDLGMRKERFAELAALREGEAALQREVSDYFAKAFNCAFPYCDPDAVIAGEYARNPPAINKDGRHVSKRELALLTPPQRRTLRELVPQARKPDAEVADYLRRRKVPLYRRFPDGETGTENEVPEVKLV